LIELTSKAQRQLRSLRQYYIDENRPGAFRNLQSALVSASRMIARNSGDGKPAPTPYPGLVQPGVAWTKSGRYWFAYKPTKKPVIVGIFFETSDIPNRI
jgi:plasmid stabilization system protein ParE